LIFSQPFFCRGVNIVNFITLAFSNLNFALKQQFARQKQDKPQKQRIFEQSTHFQSDKYQPGQTLASR
jgi:hypothetical protein